MTHTQTVFSPGALDLFFVFSNGTHYRIVSEFDRPTREFMVGIGFDAEHPPFTNKAAAEKSATNRGLISFDASLLVPA